MSHFLETLKRVVPMTFASWAHVPKTLKDTLWSYTKVINKLTCLKFLLSVKYHSTFIYSFYVWFICKQQYILPEELKVWAIKTIQQAWKGNKSRTKHAHYLAYATDEERLANKPDDIPVEDFKLLLKYWGDPDIQVYVQFCYYFFFSFSAFVFFNQFLVV